VDDLDAKLSQMGAEAKLTLGPLDMGQFIPGMRVAWISDPDGNIVELNQGYVDEENPPALV
jgi:glyoxylase I family protein